ncbi:glycosyltransferase family 2 protein [Azoarcus sp. DD4]|uniref:glycosyltransferase family 2 protein n=1 Tax=Azoarcus sp. DD4 TaxID=2027405 RepID=UPI00143E0C07|nr:glycosyltransferase family 2 protein [Azoarcus sp. DD4]
MSASDQAPLVSVCIPTWCGGAFLSQAIESVLQQTWPDFELVVIDDASPDDTTERVSQHLNDKRVRYLCNERNLGAQGNWNRCLDVARGRYIKVLPHDDLLSPDCLERQVDALERHPDAVLAFGARRIIDSRNRQLFIKRPPWPTGQVSARDVLRGCVRGGTNLIGEPGAVLFRRSAAVKAGAFDASIPYVLDLDYWSRLLAQGDAWCDKAALASFRVSHQSWSVAIGRKQAEEFERFIDRIAQQPQVLANGKDRFIGRARARANGVARRVIYALTLTGKRETS